MESKGPHPVSCAVLVAVGQLLRGNIKCPSEYPPRKSIQIVLVALVELVGKFVVTYIAVACAMHGVFTEYHHSRVKPQ